MMDHKGLRELLPLYALTSLEAKEALEVEEHLRGGCESCATDLRRLEAVVTELGFSATSVAPPKEVLQKILGALDAPEETESQKSAEDVPVQVWKNWGPSTPALPFMSLVRSDQGTWERSGDGRVQVKRLSMDPEHGLVTMLVRMEPGSSYPRHRHTKAEECYVIQGDLHVGEVVLRDGDFQRAEPQSVHPIQFTEDGCLLLVTSSLEDEILT